MDCVPKVVGVVEIWKRNVLVVPFVDNLGFKDDVNTLTVWDVVVVPPLVMVPIVIVGFDIVGLVSKAPLSCVPAGKLKLPEPGALTPPRVMKDMISLRY